MRGLLLKDFYMILKYCRLYAILVVAFTVVSVFSDNNRFFMVYPVIICSMIPQTLLAYEERAGWDKYSLAFPYSGKQIVSAKYILTIIAVMLALNFSMTVNIIRLFNGTGTVNEVINTHLFIAAVGLLAPAITMPVIFRFGTEKGRIIYLITIGSVCAASTVLSVTANTPELKIETPIIAPIVLVSEVLFALSWIISIKIYEKREI